MNFKVGDKATAFGVMGTITSISDDGEYPILWIRDGGDKNQRSFTKDGREYYWYLESQLIFVSRPKTMVKKSKQMWVNVYRELDGEWSALYPSKDKADWGATSKRIATVPVTVEWEEEA